jgi:hypothetical protein
MTATKTEITVNNSRQSPVKAGGHYFAPRASTTVKVDEHAAAAIASTRGLTVAAAGRDDALALRRGLTVAAAGRDDALALRRGLVTRAKELGIPAVGKNADLAAAIGAAEATAASAAPSGGETEASAAEPGTGDVTAGETPTTDQVPAE